MTLDFSRCRLPPFQHQREDTEWLVNQSFAFIASEMRTGKTKIVIDSAQFLFEQNKIDKVIVCSPAPVRDVWYDPIIGELKKHLWENLPAKVIEFHSRIRMWKHGPETDGRMLEIYVTNFEFLRAKARVKQLISACGHRTWLVGDESSALKNHSAQQTQAFLSLRRKCGRVVLLNGTPIFHSPLDLFSQGNILHERILECKYVTAFKARYAVQAKVMSKDGRVAITDSRGKIVYQTVGWTNLDDIERRFKPYTRRRLQSECADMPPKLDPVTLTATLDPDTWRKYRSMRDDLVIWLSSSKVVTAATAAVKVLRLAQITGGILTGIEDAGVERTTVEPGLLESLDLGGLYGDFRGARGSVCRDDDRSRNVQDSTLFEASAVEERSTCSRDGEIDGTQRDQTDISGVSALSREKLDVLLWFIDERLKADPNLHLVIWSRFRAEAIRAYNEVNKKFPHIFESALLMGGQTRAERHRALSLLKPETSPKGPVFIAGVEGTGSFGIDMCAAHTCVTLSSGYSPGRSAQTLDRVYGPGQKFPIAYYNIVAVGPKGQRTIDHDIIQSRMTGENIAQRTVKAWIVALKNEEG